MRAASRMLHSARGNGFRCKFFTPLADKLIWTATDKRIIYDDPQKQFRVQGYLASAHLEDLTTLRTGEVLATASLRERDDSVPPLRNSGNARKKSRQQNDRDCLTNHFS